ncbi:hypothetical protein N7527_009025 [Penicillium freii]|nr:hypothetical protein N7527_009025 [Penicillium freii]
MSLSGPVVCVCWLFPLKPAAAPRMATRRFGKYGLPKAGNCNYDTVNTHIRTALQSDAATQDAQVVGIGTTKTGYLFRFKNMESAQMARNNTMWLRKLGNITKPVKPRFGVVVYTKDSLR